MSDYKKLFKKMKYLMPVWLNILLQAIKREKKEREKAKLQILSLHSNVVSLRPGRSRCCQD